jgi:hypothetical protein
MSKQVIFSNHDHKLIRWLKDTNCSFAYAEPCEGHGILKWGIVTDSKEKMPHLFKTKSEALRFLYRSGYMDKLTRMLYAFRMVN